jgi:hypothetical protein
MSSAVEPVSCSKVDVPAAGPEPEDAAAPAGHGEAAPCCHEEEEDEEEKAPQAIDLGPMVSIKEQLEKDKVRALAARHSLQPPAIDAKLLSRRGASSILKRVSYSLGWCV